MSGEAPAVSVLLPAHNREHWVGDAIRSVINQSFDDWEVVIVDDGSTDRTAETVQAFDDPRVRLVRHEANKGIPAARNSALEAARGRFIAWLDSDDVARPNRLAEQLAFLEMHPEFALVGSCAGKIDAAGRRKRGLRIPPFAYDDIRAWQLFQQPFQQSSLMGRAPILKRYPYRAEFPVCEDVDVLIRIAQDHRVANLPKVLIDRRLHEGQTVATRQGQMLDLRSALALPLLQQIGISPTAEDLVRHADLGLVRTVPAAAPREYLDWAEGWLRGLLRANKASRMFSGDALSFVTGQVWLRACRRAAALLGPVTLGRFFTSRLALGCVGRNGRAWAAEAAPLLVAER